jgi:hypothetical protein
MRRQAFALRFGALCGGCRAKTARFEATNFSAELSYPPLVDPTGRRNEAGRYIDVMGRWEFDWPCPASPYEVGRYLDAMFLLNPGTAKASPAYTVEHALRYIAASQVHVINSIST